MQHLLSQAAHAIHTSRSCALATSSLDGTPWNCPVRYSVDDSCRLFWISATESQHASLLRENPRASITIFDNQTVSQQPAVALYLQGEVDIVENESMLAFIVQRHYERMGKKTPYSAHNFQGDSPRRVYRFVPARIWILAEPRMVDGHAVNRRVELDLFDLFTELIARSTAAAKQQLSIRNEQDRYRWAR